MSDETSSLTFGLKTADFAAIISYLALTFGISVWFGRKQKSVDDYFVGGRRMPWFAVGLSILATLFSTLSYLAVPGYVIKTGVVLFFGYLAVPFSAWVVLKIWVPFFMRLRLTSAYEYLERRFNRVVRRIGAGLFILLRLGWMSMVIYAASQALDRVKGPDLEFLPGPDFYWWIGLIGVVAAVYTAIGGIQAVIWIDVLQCLLLLTGVLLAIGFVSWIDGTGPLDWWNIAKEHRPEHTAPPLFHWNITIADTIVFMVINNFFWTICTHGSDQVVLQRYFSTASLKSARRSYLINIIVDFTMAILLATAGLALLAFYLGHANLLPAGAESAVSAAKELFPHFLSSQLPPGCAGLIISAFLCDAIQTLESGVNAITAVTTNDFLRPHHHHGEALPPGDPHKGEPDDLAFARMLTTGVTVVSTCGAYGVAFLQASNPDLTLVELMPKFFNMFVGPLASLFFIGMFLPRCTARSAIPAVLLSLALSVLWSWWKQIFRVDVGPAFSLAIAVPYVTSVCVALLLSVLVERRGPHPGHHYTWRHVIENHALPDDASASRRDRMSA